MTIPKPEGDLKFTQVSAGSHHSLALGSDGQAYSWGYNEDGQLGNGTVNYIPNPVPLPVSAPAGVAFTLVSAGTTYSLAIGSDGKTYAWGCDSSGQLGNGEANHDPHPDPTQVLAPEGVVFTLVSAGGAQSLDIARNDKTYAWGNNEHGQLGNDSTEAALTPVQVRAPEGVSFTEVSAGYPHSLALDEHGQAFAWGDNYAGQLGDGTNSSSSVPVVVGGEVQVTGALFGEVPGTDLVDNGDGTVTVASPAHVAGAVDVSVEWTLGGVAQDPVVYPGAFTFEDPVAPEVVVERFAGSSRYGTNLALLKATFVAGDPLFVATGAVFADALSVGPDVAVSGGGLALTPKNKLDPA